MSKMKRREFITLVGGVAAWPLAARAQPSGRPVRVGILTHGGELANPLFDAFRQEMRRLGYVEGRTLVLEFRSAAGADRLPDLAAELVRLPVDVIVVEGTPAARAAKQATSSIPIVMGVVAEPVETGLVTNLARPDGNITGFTSLTPELSTKRLGLLKEAFPEMKRVGVLRNPRNPGNVLQLASLKEAAATLGIDVETAEAERRDAIGPALDQLRERGASAVIILGDSVYFNEHKLIVLLVTAKRLPAIYPDRVFADAGGMIFYGPDITDNFRRAADYVDRILKGTKPGDLPVQRPTKFELIINAALAKAIGVTLPTTLLLRADEVIE
jgi:putative tryptophan/tyrosine transport system substrate-binding protein